jgi:NAD(P)-dependent dehydrogenase (short-subunit alcohol dehydrogenase family)
MDDALNGKVAILTGAGRGLGRAMALGLARGRASARARGARERGLARNIRERPLRTSETFR